MAVTFIEDDLTDLRRVAGTFDFLVDLGALNDLGEADRNLYMQNVIPLARPGSRYLLGCFEKKLKPGEIERRFGEQFTIETVPGEPEAQASTIGFRYFLMTSY